jgi:uncharacterized protein (DUF1015 family)
MATLRPFAAYRPRPALAAAVAARPYDVLNADEARAESAGNPLSFLHVSKPEIDLDPATPHDDPRVYAAGRDNLAALIARGALVADPAPALYVYALTMDGHTQCGVVGCASVDDYWNDIIRKHELTRRDKEEDRCNHVRVTNAHTGPIFLTYRDDAGIDADVAAIVAAEPDNDHVAADGIRHRSWMVRDPGATERLRAGFAALPHLYVADGHHRSAAAAIVGRERRAADPARTGDEEYNFFLAVCFPASQLRILDYNRLVADLNGLASEEFLARIGASFDVADADAPVRPARKGEFGLFLDGAWRLLRLRASGGGATDPVEGLDVSVLQRLLLERVLGIGDPRTDRRIDFVGGIRGLGELERRVRSGEMRLAISMHPTSIDELLAIADAGKVMPPKSTWFEPKLRDGLFVHFLD